MWRYGLSYVLYDCPWLGYGQLLSVDAVVQVAYEAFDASKRWILCFDDMMYEQRTRLFCSAVGLSVIVRVLLVLPLTPSVLDGVALSYASVAPVQESTVCNVVIR